MHLTIASSALSSDVEREVRVLARCCWPVLSATREEEKEEGEMERRWVDSEPLRKEGM